ncbi:zinc finger protein 233-like isoform X1 [Bos javanicus]|uniref:zinc finger protein 233-like isoform X1 n=1 Tax=Bos javanicus TaxID=9906 RepID=UPI002AA607D7|nr:zinc finger protein 233-like isoform X1 [Bos javanicus]
MRMMALNPGSPKGLLYELYCLRAREAGDSHEADTWAWTYVSRFLSPLPLCLPRTLDFPQNGWQSMTKFQEAVLQGGDCDLHQGGAGTAGLGPEETYPDMMLENFWNLVSMGYQPFTLDIILQLGREEQLWVMEPETRDECSGHRNQNEFKK